MDGEGETVRYPEVSTVIRTDIEIDRVYLRDVLETGAENLTFRTVLDLTTNTLAMQVLEDGRIVGERGVYQGAAPNRAGEGGGDAAIGSAG